jgi:uncharacterized protein YecT (DUF1311 family)
MKKSMMKKKKGSFLIMKYNRTFFATILIGLFVLLAACEGSSDKSSAMDSESQENKSMQNTDNDSSNPDSKKNASNTDNPKSDTNDTRNNETNETAEKPNNELKEEDSSTNNPAGLKEEYLKKLNDTKKETEEIRNDSENEITYALKSTEGNLFDVWDGLLNEIYGVLVKQLPSEEMDQLRKDQRGWINNRDHTAKEASLKYEGGTMEQLEYVTVLNNLTQERCFELVEDYMK